MDNNNNNSFENVQKLSVIRNANMKIGGMKLRDDLQRRGGKYSQLVKNFLEKTDLQLEELMGMCCHISLTRDYDQNPKFKTIVSNAVSDYPNSKLTPRLTEWPERVTASMDKAMMPLMVDSKKLRLPWNLIAEALRGELYDYFVKDILINMRYPKNAGSMLPFYLFKLDKIMIFVCKRIALIEKAFSDIKKSAPGVLEEAVKMALRKGKSKATRGADLTKFVSDKLKLNKAFAGEFEDGLRYSQESKLTTPADFNFVTSIIGCLHGGWLFSMRQIYKCEDMRVSESVTMDTKQKIVAYVVGSIYRMAGEKTPEKIMLRKFKKETNEPAWYVDYFEKFAAVRAVHDALKRTFAGEKATGENIYSGAVSGEITPADVDLDLLLSAPIDEKEYLLNN